MANARHNHPLVPDAERSPLPKARISFLPYSATDGDAVLEALQDAHLLHWLAALPVPVDRDTGEKYLQFLGDPDVRACVLRVDGTLAGVVSLSRELSFWVRRDFHHMGLGSWAVRHFLSHLPADTGLVSACSMQHNTAAAAVLTKLGFERVGPPFRRFSFADGCAVEFVRYQRLCTGREAGRGGGYRCYRSSVTRAVTAAECKEMQHLRSDTAPPPQPDSQGTPEQTPLIT